MSRTYTTRAGDTFESIARKKLGSHIYESNIIASNPGVIEPLSAGLTIILPDIQNEALRQTSADNPNDVAVLIDGVRFRFWTSLVLRRHLDSLDTLELVAPFEPDSLTFRRTFRPFSFKDVVVTVGGSVLFSGTLINVAPSQTANNRTVLVSCYAKPGVLNDCTAPVSLYPKLEFIEQNLEDIAKALCLPFGLDVLFESSPGAAFSLEAIEPNGKILDFLSDLARQRSLVISNTAEGALLFRRSVDASRSTPIAFLRQGESPAYQVDVDFSPQDYYSHITGVGETIIGIPSEPYTVRNPHLTSALRPLVFKSPDVEGAELSQSVSAKMGRMFGSMCSYTMKAPTWRDERGNLWSPNTTIKLDAPGAMIYSPYKFIIRSVQFNRESNVETAELDLVLPGAFSGEIPEALPWD